MMTPKRHLSSPFILALILSVSFYGCSVSDPDVVIREEPVETVQPDPFIRGVVTVQFDEETTLRVESALGNVDAVATRAPQFGGVFEGLGVKSLRRVFPDAGEFEERTRREGLHRFYYVEFDEETAPTRAASDLRALPGVVSVTPQIPVRPRKFNDPYFSSQWHLFNVRYAGIDINVQKVWDEFTVGRQEVIVSVVDEGVYMDHEDLAGNLVPCLEDGTGSYNFNNDTPTVVPTQGHGTHVAGVIAAVSNNGIGVAGVAGGDAAAGIGGVKVMSCQIFDLYGNQPDLYQAIKHGADHGAVILQCSWGFSPDLDHDGFTTDEEIALYRSYTIDDLPEYKAAIDYFIKYAGCDNDGNQLPDSPMKGGVAVFAAGNDNFDYDPLVAYEPIIAVGSFGATGNKASYSNYGDWLDIAAPGGDAKQGIYSTLLYNNYGGSDWQGTSMACPHVSGVAALLVSYFGGPGFTAEECRTRILRGAVSGAISGSRYVGRKLDAYGAFICDPTAPVQAPVLTWTGSVPKEIAYNDHGEFPFTVKDPLGLYTWVYLIQEMPGVSLETTGDAEYKIVVDAETLGKGSFSIQVAARNEDQAVSTLTLPLTVLPNQAPDASQDDVAPILIGGPGEEVSVSAADWFSDPEGDPLSFTATVKDASVSGLTVGENGTLALKGLRFGLTQLSVKASDGNNLAPQVLVPVAVKNPAGAYVYPTSATSEIHIAVNNPEPARVSVKIFSSTGASAGSWEGEASIFTPVTMPVHDLAPGIYSVRIAGPDPARTVTFSKR